MRPVRFLSPQSVAEDGAYKDPISANQTFSSEHLLGTDHLGRDTLNLRRNARRSIQYIFQDPYASLSPRQTVGKAIDEALLINGERNAAARRQRTFELLDSVGISRDMYDRYAREMSGGQRQRICSASDRGT